MEGFNELEAGDKDLIRDLTRKLKSGMILLQSNISCCDILGELKEESTKGKPKKAKNASSSDSSPMKKKAAPREREAPKKELIVKREKEDKGQESEEKEEEKEEATSIVDKYSIAGLIPRTWRRAVVTCIDSLVRNIHYYMIDNNVYSL